MLRISDINKNGRLDKGDSLRLGFTVTASGRKSLDGVHVVDKRFERLHLDITCATSQLAVGASTRCVSDKLTITPYQAKHGFGRNFAFAAASASGKDIRSRASILDLGSSVAKLKALPNTGSVVTTTQVAAVSGMLLLGALLLGLARRRRYGSLQED